MLAYSQVFGWPRTIQIGALYTHWSVHFHIILENYNPCAYTPHSIGESATMFTGEVDHVAIARSMDDFYLLSRIEEFLRGSDYFDDRF